MEIKSYLLNDDDFKFVKETLVAASEEDGQQEIRRKVIHYINDSSRDADDIFFFDMLVHVRFLMPGGEEVAYTDPEGRIYLNCPNDHIGNSLRKWDYIYDHECLHQLWDTFKVEDKIKESGIEFNHYILNVASDCVINDYLSFIRKKEEPEGLITRELLDKQFGVLYDRKNDTQYSLYLKLIEKKNEVLKNQTVLQNIDGPKIKPGQINQQDDNGGGPPPPGPSFQPSDEYIKGWTQGIKDVQNKKVDPLNYQPKNVQNDFDQGYNDVLEEIRKGIEDGITISKSNSGGGGGSNGLPNIPWDIPNQDQDNDNDGQDGDQGGEGQGGEGQDGEGQDGEGQDGEGKGQGKDGEGKDGEGKGKGEDSEGKDGEGKGKGKDGEGKGKGKDGEGKDGEGKSSNDEIDNMTGVGAGRKAEEYAKAAKKAAEDAKKAKNSSANNKDKKAKDYAEKLVEAAEEAAERAENAAREARQAAKEGKQSKAKDAAKKARAAFRDAKNAVNKLNGNTVKNVAKAGQPSHGAGKGPGSQAPTSETEVDIKRIAEEIRDLRDKYRNKIAGALGEFVTKCKSSATLNPNGLAVTAKATSTWDTKMNIAVMSYVRQRINEKKRFFKKTYNRIKRGAGYQKYGDPLQKGKTIERNTLPVNVAFYIDSSGSMGTSLDRAIDAAYKLALSLSKDISREKVVSDINFKMYVWHDRIDEVTWGTKKVGLSGGTQFDKLLPGILERTGDYLINVIITDAEFNNEPQKLVQDYINKSEGMTVFITNNPRDNLVKPVVEKSMENRLKMPYILADANFTIEK